MRTLLVFVTLCAIACSWLAVKMRQAERQRKAVAAIEKLGGVVLYDWQAKLQWHKDGLHDGLTMETRRPLRFLFFVPDDYLFRVEEVLFIPGDNVADADLECLQVLTDLKTLHLSRHTKVTDEGVKKLQQALPNCKMIR